MVLTQGVTLILAKTNDQELINIYKTVEMLKHQYKHESAEKAYLLNTTPELGPTAIQILQKKLFTNTSGKDNAGNLIIYDNPGFIIQYEAQREGSSRLAKMLNCSLQELQNGNCQPIIKNPEDIYTKEEKRINFLKRLLQTLQQKVDVNAKNFNWIIDFNWLSTLENFNNIDIKDEYGNNFANFDFNRFYQEMNDQQEKIRKVLSSIKSDFGSVESTRLTITIANGNRLMNGFTCNVKSTTIIKLPNNEMRELIIDPSFYATNGLDFSIRPINSTSTSISFDYLMRPEEKNLARLIFPSEEICDIAAEKMALYCALKYAK